MDGVDLKLLRGDLLQLMAAPHAKGVVRTEVVEAAVGVRRVTEDERRGIVRPELTCVGDVALVTAQRLQRAVVLQAGELTCRAERRLGSCGYERGACWDDGGSSQRERACWVSVGGGL